MAKLFELLSENPDNDKILSSLKRISKPSRAPSTARAPSMGSQPSPRRDHIRDELFDFVAIDVETTGLDPKADRIIEIGAVLFSGGQARGEYSTLVNPGVSLPRQISQLTGIQNQDLQSAPAFEGIVERFLAFIAGLPLCGHQIEFDINFLNGELKRTGREKISSPQIDTALLSRIVVPAISRYSLKHVATALGVTLDHAHRALADAKASGHSACSLLSQFTTIPEPVRAAMAHFAPPSLLKTLLFKSLDGRKKINEISLGYSPQKPLKKITPAPSPEELPLETVRQLFSSSGGLSQTMQGFVERPTQTRMAVCVAEALNTATFLVAEAGTGTGKTLAYVCPSALYAVKNNCRVLVSTHTRNLQDQLISKDLPIVKEAMRQELRFCVLKGRSNYLCIQRYYRLIAGNLTDLSFRERMGILPLIRWAMETKTGDIEEQGQFNIKWFSRIWRMICAEAHLCEGKQCPRYTECFLQNARQRALGSHIVVINHALFFSEICSETSFLGKIGPIIFDEAHHLESCGHRHLRVEVDTNRFTQFIDAAAQLAREIKNRVESIAPEITVSDFKSIVKRLRLGMNAFLDDCNAWVDNQRPPEDDYQLAYPSGVFSQWASCAGLSPILSEAQRLFHQLLQALEPGRDEQLLRSQVRLLADKTSQLKADLDYAAGAEVEDHVFWIEGNRKKGWVKLCGVPLDIGSILSRLWESNGGPCIFTSATLAVSRSLDYFRQKAGLSGPNEAKTRCEVFESPFSPLQAFRAAMRNSPEPDAPEYPGYVASVIESLVSAFRKNVLVLFTSNAMLEAVYEQCKRLPAINQTILAQGISGGRAAILDEFKNSACGVLLGADSFWEGIDAPGAACEIVIIPRLPFQVPTHPLTKAIAERIERQAGESFFSYTVPEAIIKLRQGIGRLIRSPHDRGALLVLDKRIIIKNYGKRFRSSLDGELLAFSTIEDLLKAMQGFFDDIPSEQTAPLTYVPFEELE